MGDWQRVLAWVCLSAGIGLILFAIFQTPARLTESTSPPSPENDFFLISQERAGNSGDVLSRYQCRRCHDLPGQEKLPQEQSCVGCHQGIFRGDFDNRFSKEAVDRWKSHIHHLLLVPDLKEVSWRLRPEWVSSYLRSPHVVRPHLGAMMPRLKLGEVEIREILGVLYRDVRLEQTSETTPDRARAQGESLYRESGCSGCHEFSGVLPCAGKVPGEKFRELPMHIRMAPDLRFLRDRMNKRAFAKWLKNETGFREIQLMPQFDFGREQIDALFVFLTTTPLPPEEKQDAFVPLPPLTRDIFYAEIEAKITKRLCWHCHAKPIPRTGDGGPGNTGGFGYEGAGLDLGSYEGIRRGAMRRPEASRDILARDESGEPRIVAHLLARHREMRGELDSAHLGMPLGLPPLSAEEIQLIKTWIEQGARYER